MTGRLNAAEDPYCPEFDCCECRRHIIAIVGNRPDLPLCHACTVLPGWFRDPAMREAIDADHDGRDPAGEAAP